MFNFRGNRLLKCRLFTAFIFFLQITLGISQDSKPKPRTLLPVNLKRSGHEPREVLLRGASPQTEVSLYFGEAFDIRRIDPVHVASVKFIADPSRPILVLEEIDELITSVSCRPEPQLIDIGFRNVYDLEHICNIWTSALAPEFVLVSNHHGCNPAEQRGAYIVHSIKCGFKTHTATLGIRTLEWQQVGRKMSIEFDNLTPDAFHSTLRRRQSNSTSNSDDSDDGIEGSEMITFNSSLLSREPLFSDVIDPGVNVEMTCVDCGTGGDLLISGQFDMDLDIAPVNITVDTAYLEFTVVRNITARVAVETALSASLTYEFSVPLMAPVTFPGFSIPPFVSVGPVLNFDLVIAMGLGSASINFTYGAEMNVPAGAYARFDLLNSTDGRPSSGWNETSVDEIPFTINELNGDLELSVNITAKPSLLVGIDVGSGLFTAGPQLELDFPKVYSVATPRSNVNASCEPPIESDYTYYPAAIYMETGIELGASASLSLEANFTGIPGISEELSVDIFTLTYPIADACMILPENFGVLLASSEVTPTVNETKRLELSQESLALNGSNDSGSENGTGTGTGTGTGGDSGSGARRVSSSGSALMLGILVGLMSTLI